MLNSISVGIIGASGYTGLELIRLLHVHPNISQVSLYGKDSAGKFVSEIYPGLNTERFDEKIYPITNASLLKHEVLFLAVSHGAVKEIVHDLDEKSFKGLIIDLSTDFRWENSFTYGIAEWMSGKIKQSKRIANPGCFATAIQLGLLPLVSNQIQALFHITAMTGSTGSGAGLKPGVQFSERFGNVKAYKVLSHQHEKEIKKTAEILFNQKLSFQFTPLSGPFTRGIFATISFSSLKPNLISFFEESYFNKPFIRLIEGSLPELKHVVGSNYTDIGVVQQGSAVIIGVALDNLTKGASGQAIQNMNIALGLDETAGLLFPGYLL